MTLPATGSDNLPALAATAHDPDGRFSETLEHVRQRLSWYSRIAVVVTSNTAESSFSLLRRQGVLISTIAPGLIGEARRTAVRMASDCGASSILACDLDRWLHWASTYPDELAKIPARVAALRSQPWFVCLGRTERAFRSHPHVQQDAERATNHALELATGVRIDATAGACWLSAEAAAIIVSKSVETTSATDLEWPALIHSVDPPRLSYLETEGLEFETATFYRADVERAGGLAQWVALNYERPEMWRDRLKLAADSVAALSRVLSGG